MHESFFLESPQPKGLVIFIHGLMGSPRQFTSLAHNIYESGYSVAALLLPGHGSTASDFSKGTEEAWLAHVLNQVENFSKQYANIWLVGHSMGCLLALQVAAKHPMRIRGLFLIACPFKLKILSLQLINVRFQQLFSNKDAPLKSAYREGRGVPLSPVLLWHSIKPAMELRRLAAATRELLPRIVPAVCAVYNQKDEVVSLKSASAFQSLPAATFFCQMTLPQSYHAYFPESDKQIITRELSRFLAQTAPSQEIKEASL